MTETIDISVWDRQFSLPIEYDCYAGETITTEQADAWNSFLTHPEWIAAAKQIVENYCREQVIEDDGNNKKDHIFSYVKPAYFFIKREAENPRVAMLCNYRYDPEHGLAVIFKHNGEITVCSQDEV